MLDESSLASEYEKPAHSVIVLDRSRLKLPLTAQEVSQQVCDVFNSH